MTHTPEVATLPCGCKFISRKYLNGEHGALDFCLLHKSAPDLLEALEDLVKARDLKMGPGAVTLRYEIARDLSAKARP